MNDMDVKTMMRGTQTQSRARHTDPAFAITHNLNAMEHSNSPGSSSTGQKAPQILPTILLSTQNIALLSVVVALLSIALITVFSRRRSKARGSALLLVGPPDGGKTTILSTLIYGQALQTHTSLQTNSSVVELSSKKNIRVVDIPGHPRIRDQFREYLDDAKAIAFVVDASTVSRNAAMIAEHLHNILHTITSLPPSQTLPSLVILAHKRDLLNAGSQGNAAADSLAVNRVKTVLERELEKRRASQTGGVGVEGLGEEGEKSEMGGLDCSGPAGGGFEFAEWEGGEISFIGTSAKVQKATADPEKIGDDGLSSFFEWLDESM
ncbi:P-loop containing nucleoside triphosphate hydrolase protein [Lyophyllum atratum]|nr:P-loop containing nucleoside triphosphate hydrolase protein [Lyophyllum atratum]